MRINHNISALNTNNQLMKNNNATSSSLAKLSSGLRINSAADDAAGLAISEKMRGQISGLDQAQSNANDGISMIQTAEGALSETHSILQRMRELAVQSANDTNTDDDRLEMQKEIDQLTSEITRISTDTEFNTKKLLDGSMSSSVALSTMTAGVTTNIAAGASLESGVYNVSITNFVAGTPAQSASSVSVSGTFTGGANAAYTYKTIADDAVGADGWYSATDVLTDLSTVGLSTTGTAYSGTVINAVAADAGTAASAGADTPSGGATGSLTVANVTTLMTGLGSAAPAAVANGVAQNTAAIVVTNTAPDTYTLTADGAAVGTTYTLAQMGTTFGITMVDGGDGETFSFTLTGAENALAASASVTQTAQADATDPTYTATITDGSGARVSASNFEFTFADTIATGDPISGNVTVDSTNASKFQIGANSGQNTSLSMNDMSATSLGVNAIDLTTQASADSAIKTIDDAITKVSSQRAALGASQNRLEHTINNLSTSSENLSAAESQIRDVDMAKEMTEYTKNNILSQAAQAMLAQANQQPQNVLQLLQ